MGISSWTRRRICSGQLLCSVLKEGGMGGSGQGVQGGDQGEEEGVEEGGGEKN